MAKKLEPSNPKPTFTPEEAHTQESSNMNEPAHKQIQAVHEKYFQDIAQVWSSTLQRMQSIQTDYERSMEKARLTQDPNLFQSANAECQRSFQAAYTDTSPIQQYADVYRNYKLNMQKAIAEANMDELGFTDLAHISQSLYVVMWTALSLTSAGTLSSPLQK